MTVTSDPATRYNLGRSNAARARALAVVIGLGLNICSFVGLGVGLGRGFFLVVFLVSAFVSGTVFIHGERSDEIDPVLDAAMVGVRWRQPATASVVDSVCARMSRVSRLARRVAGWTVRLLPAPDRARYRDELAAELYELRESSRRAQLAYAVRLLVRSVSLRRALRQVRPAVTM
jgi:hypothetical protein